ncbi:MAG: acyl-CoA dehydrogenase family protein [Bacteroidota bacterium]
MNVLQKTKTDWNELVHQIGPDFESLAQQKDHHDTFVYENYDRLKQHNFFSAMITEELGGAGLSYVQNCHLIKTLATYCSSTALAFSMHQHLVAASLWKYKNKGVGKELLKKIVNEQLILISTGAKDWLSSNGDLERIKGGYLFSAKKHFASQSEIGDIAVTSAPYLNEAGNWEVLHFSVPMHAEGVSVGNDWKVLGMRATGSHTIHFEQVFIPESSIALRRPRGEYHPVWNLVLGVAMPLIMSAYVGIAEKAREIAITYAQKQPNDYTSLLIGRLNNSYMSAVTQWKAMYALNNNLAFTPNENMTVQMLSLKTNVAEACKQVVNDAMDVVGGAGFYRKNTLERLFRDVQASHFHPLPKWKQYGFTGNWILKQI